MKRRRESECIGKPFVKEENKIWSINWVPSLARSVSPPPTSLRHQQSSQAKSITAQVEAGEKNVEDHLSFFSSKLLAATRPHDSKSPRLDHNSWVNLYTSNSLSSRGHHFVIHQHDHPVAGTHYDLRLQCNGTSSVSWAIMYGLPGDPNSRRLNRNATETRIHCLWNHLIETASHQTGTLLIWDTGVYEVLPHRSNDNRSNNATTDQEDSDQENVTSTANAQWHNLSEPEKLHQSFRNRRICLRLHGTRLPENYTLNLWLRSSNDRSEQPAAPKTKRRKGAPSHSKPTLSRRSSSKVEYNTDSDRTQSSTDSNPSLKNHKRNQSNLSSLQRYETPPLHSLPPSSTQPQPQECTATASASASDNKNKNEVIRKRNAYPESTNTINSIHQRKWYLCLNRQKSGFIKDTDSKRWVPRSQTRIHINTTTTSTEDDRSRKEAQGFHPFYVLGRECERSVVTGRLAGDVLVDEGVEGYVPRGKWRAVVE